LAEKSNYHPFRKNIPRFSELSNEERNALILQNPKFGHVVCRCEAVTEGEIVEAIRRGARTVQGIQFRTRAGMGRCQRGFCGPRVVEILARELGIPQTKVTFKGPGSEILKYRSKELLH
jgi:glycerol-3-phosphate dehydrogenase